MMRGIDGHRYRLFAWGRRPSPSHGRGARVDLYHFADIGEIRVDPAVVGRNSILRFAAQIDIGDQLPSRVNHWLRNAKIAVHGEYAIRRLIDTTMAVGASSAAGNA